MYSFEVGTTIALSDPFDGTKKPKDGASGVPKNVLGNKTEFKITF
jgi:hypothetical protein